MKKISTILFLISISFLLTPRINAQQNSFGWAIKTGAQFSDAGFDITTDASGNVYTTGYFEGTVDFDPGAGTFNLTYHLPARDVFVQKLTSAGTFGWAKAFGGIGFDYGYSIHIDAGGNILLTGSFEGTVDFDPGANTFNLTSGGGHDIFIVKLDASGNFTWAKSFGSTGEDEGLSVTTDLNSNVIATGHFSNTTDFDPGASTFNLTSNGLFDNFTVKLDNAGNFNWATQLGGTNYDFSRYVTTDAAGNVYTTGTFGATVDFDPGVNTYFFTSNGGSNYGDIFIQKLDAGGNFAWAKQMGGFGDDIGTTILVDATGNVYTTGWFQVTVDFDPGADTTDLITTGTATGNPYSDDVFIQKLDAAGNFTWAVNMGGSGDDRGLSLAFDNAGNLCTTGSQSGGDFDPGTGTFPLSGNGAFLSKLNNAGNFIWAKQMTGSVKGNSIASDLNGSLFSVGDFDHTVDFDPGTGNFSLSSNNGDLDMYVHKLNSPTSAIDENSFDNSNNIFPNPNNGQFTIELGKVYPDAIIEIKNITGQVVYSNTFSEASMMSVDLKQPAGVYFVTIISGQTVRTLKLVIE